jgi:hypothetical protein
MCGDNRVDQISPGAPPLTSRCLPGAPLIAHSAMRWVLRTTSIFSQNRRAALAHTFAKDVNVWGTRFNKTVRIT